MASKRRSISQYEVRDPNKILANIINDYVEGKFTDYQWLHRAVVTKIDYVGGLLEDEPKNPRGSVRARIVSDSSDKYSDEESLNVFWPLFPFSLFPVKEGEHIYVVFEDENREHGLWISRIPEPGEVDSKNYVPGFKKFVQFSDGRVTDSNAETLVQDVEESALPLSASAPFVLEENSPDFNSRVGDYTIQGSNNTLINLGRDRVTTTGQTDTGLRDQAGTIDLVTGRAGTDINFATDKSRIYISSNTQADANFNIQAGEGVDQAPTVVIKSNQIRILAREGTKIVNEAGAIVIQTPGNITIEGANINIGLNAQEAAVLGDTLKNLLEQLCQKISAITVPTAMGPSGPPVNAAEFATLSGQLSTALSQTVKVKP